MMKTPSPPHLAVLALSRACGCGCTCHIRPFSFSFLGSARPRRFVSTDTGDADKSTHRSPSSSATATIPPSTSAPPFRFLAGVAYFAKRAPRPFPPPFHSPPSGSFSDPLSTHDRSRDRRAGPQLNGQLLKGRTNGDDAVYASERFICANDGVGAWSMRPKGHAGLWSRLILHFWITKVESDLNRNRAADESYEPDPVADLQHAYEQTLEATLPPNDWQGTTTACSVLLHAKSSPGTALPSPVAYLTNIGDGQVMVVRPAERRVLYRSRPQWHWFDCPRQLGTNSPDTPLRNAEMAAVDVREGDVVLAMTDGAVDNLWEHEIVDRVVDGLERWQPGRESAVGGGGGRSGGIMGHVAAEVVEAARLVAIDPFAESPYMEHAIEEGLASEGGKLDDISVAAAMCVKK